MDPVREFENKIAAFFGAPHGIAVDSATHAVELCLRYKKTPRILCPKRTYLSIPFLAIKLNIPLKWIDFDWEDFYYVNTMDNIIDAAVFWQKESYISRSFMCLSFQHQKHLSLSRGGMILTDNKEAATQLKKMSYDGRLPGIPWREQNVDTVGYHYYMTPETAQLGLDKLDAAIKTPPRIWTHLDYPILTNMEIFKR